VLFSLKHWRIAMINVKHIKDNEYEISWDENDPIESKLNTWTEEDFLNTISEGLKRLDKLD
jgi:hypothetical protein